ncbi:MAG TPA: thiamine phosphate synthase [Opitutales bacterium]|nr:thiamine phosphate synthase [Opitutales bacterium]
MPLATARFYAILDTSYAPPARLPELCRAVLAGGADIVQLRAKESSTAQRIAMLQVLAPLCAQAGVPLICNDDITAALAVPGVGLHVGQDDLAPPTARAKLGTGRVLGLSTHSLAQAQAALALGHMLDYFAVGPIFATNTKPDYPAVGLELVRAIAGFSQKVPWFCIGGINPSTVAQVHAAGGRAVVAVSAVLQAAEPEKMVRQLRGVMT